MVLRAYLAGAFENTLSLSRKGFGITREDDPFADYLGSGEFLAEFVGLEDFRFDEHLGDELVHGLEVGSDYDAERFAVILYLVGREDRNGCAHRGEPVFAGYVGGGIEMVSVGHWGSLDVDEMSPLDRRADEDAVILTRHLHVAEKGCSHQRLLR